MARQSKPAEDPTKQAEQAAAADAEKASDIQKPAEDPKPAIDQTESGADQAPQEPDKAEEPEPETASDSQPGPAPESPEEGPTVTMYVVLPHQNFRHEGAVFGPGEIVDPDVLGERAAFLEERGCIAKLKAKKGEALAEEARKVYFDACRRLVAAEDNNVDPENAMKLTDEQLATRFGQTALT